MTTSQLAEALGEKPKAVLDAVRRGQLQAVKREHKLSPVGYQWDVTTPVEEARAIMAARVKRASPSTPRRGYKAGVSKRPETLPANRDLFRADEAAKLTGVSKSAVYKFLKDNNVATLRNGHSNYIPRSAVEQLREYFAPKAPVVVAPRAQTVPSAVVDEKATTAILDRLVALQGFLTRFAKSCGYEE